VRRKEVYTQALPVQLYKKGSNQMKRNTTKALTEGAIMISVALVLNLLQDVIPLGQLPNGGSLLNITMVPLVLYAIRWGMSWGFMAGFIFGGLNYFIGNGISIDWTTILCDYFLAFGMLGFGAGIFKHKKCAVYAGTVVGGGLQFLASYLVGVFVWGRWMPEAFLGMPMTSPWLYSLLYNGLWAVPNIILALLVFAALQKPMRKYIRGEDVQ
jgi:thiamine transporter